MNASGDAKGFLIDGFPRNQDNLQGWNREMGEKVSLFSSYALYKHSVSNGRCHLARSFPGKTFLGQRPLRAFLELSDGDLYQQVPEPRLGHINL